MNTQSRSFQPPTLSASDELKRLCTQLDFASSENKPLSPQLFDKLASNIASELDNRSKDCNKSTQIRRFYDELVGWEQKIGSDPKGFEMNEAFFRMLKAKVAYAFGRNRDERKGKVGLVDDNFHNWFCACVDKTHSAEELKHFRLHFEAVLGFLKALRG
ncbi:MAG: type III-A CRISPR-associated protein Csm2 [Betaproteobacteria bacterium]|nr:type III-A CRISPR-associated protein Csm2 [Betaproteobacteria bacterium]